MRFAACSCARKRLESASEAAVWALFELLASSVRVFSCRMLLLFSSITGDSCAISGAFSFKSLRRSFSVAICSKAQSAADVASFGVEDTENDGNSENFSILHSFYFKKFFLQNYL